MEHWSENILDKREAGYYCYVQDEITDYIEQRSILGEKRAFTKLASLLKDIRIMANSKKTPTSKGRQSNDKTHWINVPITESDIPAVDRWLDGNLGDLLGYVCNIAERGYSVSVKPDKTGGYMAAVFGTSHDDQGDYNFGVSAFASTPDDALGGLLYKFVYVLDWGAGISRPAEQVKTRFR